MTERDIVPSSTFFVQLITVTGETSCDRHLWQCLLRFRNNIFYPRPPQWSRKFTIVGVSGREARAGTKLVTRTERKSGRGECKKKKHFSKEGVKFSAEVFEFNAVLSARKLNLEGDAA